MWRYTWKFDRYLNGHRLLQKHKVFEHGRHTSYSSIEKYKCSECGKTFESRLDVQGYKNDCLVPPIGTIQKLRSWASRL